MGKRDGGGEQPSPIRLWLYLECGSQDGKLETRVLEGEVQQKQQDRLEGQALLPHKWRLEA